MKKNKTYELITLIYRCFIVFFCICFTASVLGSLLVFFKVGYFEFNWKETILLSLKKGGVIGFTLGLGLWVKARLQDRKDNKKISKLTNPAFSAGIVVANNSFGGNEESQVE
ncbi:hypothetical protein [Raoultella planticola]|uniref:hypothetical protein n=1 Tax=Raoultella planticola TaxID=575 RepID=UPI003890311D